MNQLQEHSPDLTLSIGTVAHGGDGIGHIDGKVCFVSGALPGDVARIRIYRQTDRALWGRMRKLITPSPFRTSGLACDGKACDSACKWRAFAYPEQGACKQRIVHESLKRIGGLDVDVHWREAPELRTGYRTRATFHGDGVHLGYYREHTHDVVPIDACPLNHPRLNKAFEALAPLGIRGDVHITVDPEGEAVLVWMEAPRDALRTRFPLANGFHDLERSRFVFDGAPIVNGVFSQASLLLNRMLRQIVSEAVGEPESLLDLYCGNGNLSLAWTGRSCVVGVDHAGPSIAAVNNLVPGIYRYGDESMMCALLRKEAWDVVLLDPPRVGAKALVDALAQARARRLVYVSCDPATLARDLKGIVKGGWSVIQATAVDMFPHTPHVETVCVLEQ